jgi:hypothetical protein
MLQRFGDVGRKERKMSEWKEKREENCVRKNFIVLQLPYH